MAKRKLIDWDSVEPLYRAGSMSNCEICRQYEADHLNSQVWKHTLAEGAIRKKAKAENWSRNIAEKVKRQVKENLVRDKVRDSYQTEQQLVEEAAKIPTEVRILQRKRAQALASLGDTLSAQLKSEMEYEPTKKGKGSLKGKEPKQKMSLGGMTNIYKSLVAARDQLQKMESAAFGLDEPESEALVRQQMALAEVFSMLPLSVREEIRKRATAKVGKDA